MGLDARASAFGARTQRLDPQPTSMLDRHGRPIATHRVNAVDPALTGVERLLHLAIPALMQIRWPGEPLPLYLALPEALRLDELDEAMFLEELALRAPIHVEASQVARIGPNGGAWAFEAAIDAAVAGHTVLVGGVDSLIAPETLVWLDAEERLGTSDRDGLTPSEAAAFALVGPSTIPDAARLRTAGLAGETAAAELLREASQSWLLTDLDGTTARARAFAELVMAAQGARFVQQNDLVWLYGDVGAASAPLLALHAACAYATGWAPAARATVMLGADVAGRSGYVTLEVDDA
jgi:3-oxoacyl-[acyl-carrier-protein] synthase-1